MTTTNSKAPDVFSVVQLFSACDEQRYLIPLYQRNYAWGEAEVRQLLDDVKDMAEQQKDKPYYLGSLVVSRRDNGEYELIDGQQRFTTLTIILAAIKAKWLGREQSDVVKPGSTAISEYCPEVLSVLSDPQEQLKCNLRFEGRPDSQQAVEYLFEGPEFKSGCKVSSIRQAYEVVEAFLNNLEDQSASRSDRNKQGLSLIGFVTYLLNHTRLLRTPLPDKTDLNHYFEMMNNRGEQLEKHEILKARLMGLLQGPAAETDSSPSLSQEQTGFAKVWDACAEMDRYLVMSFDNKLRVPLFGEHLDRWPESFTALCSTLAETIDGKEGASEDADDNSQAVQELSLQELIKNPEFQSKTNRQDKVYQGAFTGIINFPNFLIQVLRVWSGKKKQSAVNLDKLCLDTSVTLDDKKLLDAFKSIETAEQVRSFSHTLLICRQLLDRYVIKRKNDEKWTLRSMRNDPEALDSSYSDMNTFSKKEAVENEKLNLQLEMILSMFHVSFPGQSRKYWLSAVLGYLYPQKDDELVSIAAENYLSFLECLSDQLFFQHFCTEESNDYDVLLGQLKRSKVTGELGSSSGSIADELKQSCLNRGVHTENFIFNRLDYLLWKRLVKDSNDELFARCKGNKVFSDKLNQFSFTNRSSVEHYYPQQSKGQDFPQENGGVDRFGNLCLISQSLNSRLSNSGYEDKKRIFENSSATESLKQLLMMSYEKWGPDADDQQSREGMKNVDEHEEAMIKVLCSTSG